MSEAPHKFLIKAPLTPYGASVEFDGEPLPGVTGISFALTGGEMTEVTLTLYGEVFVEGEFRPKELAQIKRQDLHPATLRYRIRDAFRKIFLGADESYIGGLTNNVMRDLEEDSHVAHGSAA